MAENAPVVQQPANSGSGGSPAEAQPKESQPTKVTTPAPAPSFEHNLEQFSSTGGVLMVPVLEDNYSYILFDKKTRECAVVDPVEPNKVAAVIEKHDLDVKAILTTHSHWDHDGGNPEFVKLFPGITVYGGRGDKAKSVTKEVGDGDSVAVGGFAVTSIFTPCHTPGHVCYVAKGADGPLVVFTGDTLFVAGCGNFNTGTPLQMRQAFDKLSKLPETTLVCCGHEYTAANFAYARFVEPENPDLKAKNAWVAARRAKALPTIPSTIGDEMRTNPFMRVRTVKLPHCATTVTLRILVNTKTNTAYLLFASPTPSVGLFQFKNSKLGCACCNCRPSSWLVRSRSTAGQKMRQNASNLYGKKRVPGHGRSMRCSRNRI